MNNQKSKFYFLDVNFPKKNGHESSHWVKSRDHMKHLPVIMLPTSIAENDIKKSYRNYPNCYKTKPVEVEDFLNVIANIESI